MWLHQWLTAYLGEHVNSLLLVKMIVKRKTHRPTTIIKITYMLVYNRSIDYQNFLSNRVSVQCTWNKSLSYRKIGQHICKQTKIVVIVDLIHWSASVYLLINCNSDELEIYNVVKMYAIFFSLENLCTLNCNFRYIFFLSGNKHTCNIQTASCFSKTF